MFKEMFKNWMKMGLSYDERKIARDEQSGVWLLSTCMAYDSSHPFETGYAHKDINSNRITIIEEYDTKEEAAAGHKMWLKKIEASPNGKLTGLRDVSTADIARLTDAFSQSKDWRNR